MSDPSTTPSRTLARFAHSAAAEPLSARAQEKAVLCMIDALGLARGAHDQVTVQAVESVLMDAADRVPSAMLWTSGRRVSATDACLANGVAAHAHFHDDTDADASAHPGSLIVPVAIALAQHSGGSLDLAVRGIVAGYSALHWLAAEGAVRNALQARGFRGSPTLGPMAAAVAAATVLELSEEQALSAIGLATDVTGGVLEPVRSGAQDWRWQNGAAAWRGGMAGLLARAGVVGPPEPLAGDSGFLAAFTGMASPRGWAEAPTLDAIEHVWFKDFPVLGDNLAAVLAARQLHDRVDDPNRIERIKVHMERRSAVYPGTSYRGPFHTPEQALASTAFTVASMIAYGDSPYRDYSERRSDARILSLVDRLEIVPNDDYRHLDATVTVEVDGETLVADVREDSTELFFRDREAGDRAFVRNLRANGLTAGDVPNALYAWLDGGTEPALDDVLSIVVGARPLV